MISFKTDSIYTSANAWLSNLYELVSKKQPVQTSSLLQILIGKWICKRDVYLLANQIRYYLDEQYEKKDLDLNTCDFGLLLISLSIMRSLNIECSALESFASELSNALKSHQDNDPAETLDLFFPKTLLYNLGMYPKPKAIPMDLLEMPSGLNLYQASSSTIKQLVHRIDAVTVYGQRKLNNKVEDLHFVVSIWMLHAFRIYNLEMGTVLLRTMRYLNIQDTHSFEVGLNFVFAQQHSDGRFGYFAQEIAEIKLSDPNFDELQNLYLPITLSCLWAIAEVNSQSLIKISNSKRTF